MAGDGLTMISGALAEAKRPWPILFDDCVGWLHPADGDHGVVLCGPIGHEELAVHRGWRELGQRLAATGIPTLRFDYPGTGDSAGEESDPDRIERWIDSICMAAAWLRTHTNVKQVSLIGLRLGATLATLASQRINGVNTLALLTPVIVGRSYVRELRLLTNAWWEQVAPHQSLPTSLSGCLDVIGYRWDTDSLTKLGKLDLRKITVWPSRVILMDSSKRPELNSIAQLVKENSRILLMEDFPGASDFLQDPLRAKLPDLAFNQLCSLFRGTMQIGAIVSLCSPVPLRMPGIVETVHRFGPGNTLFGILCRPEVAPPSKVGLLFLNTGLTHHVGHGRLTVSLARSLALQGVTSLRMDVSAVGDSDAYDKQAGPCLHDPASAEDVRSGLDLLETYGFGQSTVFGLCSGGYQAFHAARKDARITGLILINIQKFIWAGGKTLNVHYDGNRRATRVYIRAILQRSNWSRALKGDVRVLKICRDLGIRTVKAWWHNTSLAFEQVGGNETRAGQLYRWMKQLSQRGVRINLIYSSADPGLADLRFHVSPTRLQRRFDNFKLDILPDADHCLNIYASREALSQLLAQRCLFVD